MSVPGHAQFVRFLGDIVLMLRDPNGTIKGVVITVHVAERMTIPVLARQWPEGLREGLRLDVRGQLCNEPVGHKRASHFLQAESVSVVPRQPAGRKEVRTHGP